jgi:hypothetical protein
MVSLLTEKEYLDKKVNGRGKKRKQVKGKVKVG